MKHWDCAEAIGEEEKVGKEREKRTYGHAGRHQVAIVEDEDQVLMRCFGLQVLLDATATGAQGVSGVKHMYNNISCNIVSRCSCIDQLTAPVLGFR